MVFKRDLTVMAINWSKSGEARKEGFKPQTFQRANSRCFATVGAFWLAGVEGRAK